MALAFGAISESATSASQTSYTWNHNSTGDRCAIVWVFAVASITNPVTGVTFGGTAMGAVSGGTAIANVSSGELGCVAVYFLDNISQGATTAIVVSRTNNATVMYSTAQTFTAAAKCVAYTATLQTITGTSLANPNERAIDDGSPGSDSIRVAGCYYGGNSPAPAGANSTGGTGQSNDFTSYGCSSVYETTPGQGSRNVGFSSPGSDDCAAIYFAIVERPDLNLSAASGDVTFDGGIATGEVLGPIPDIIMTPARIPVRRG